MDNGCALCDNKSIALNHTIHETEEFRVVCDMHPLTEGHLLIIPKKHISCVGAFPTNLYNEFFILYNQISDFIKSTYGYVSIFEHGVIGQTVFHAHTHILPFNGDVSAIIPDGRVHVKKFDDPKKLKEVFGKDGKYLFFSLHGVNYLVDTILGKPRFFRDRFAKALGVENRGDWKTMHENKKLMNQAMKETENAERKWRIFSKK